MDPLIVPGTVPITLSNVNSYSSAELAIVDNDNPTKTNR
jgi:hypothetical protein